MTIHYCKEHKEWNTMVCPFCELKLKRKIIDYLTEYLKDEGITINMDWLIKNIKKEI